MRYVSPTVSLPLRPARPRICRLHSSVSIHLRVTHQTQDVQESRSNQITTHSSTLHDHPSRGKVHTSREATRRHNDFDNTSIVGFGD